MKREIMALLKDRSIDFRNGVYYLTSPEDAGDLEGAYLELREKEGRIYEDALLQNLPDIEPDHPLHKEWMIRKDTMAKFARYISKHETPLTLLDVGCGNGWMSNHLSRIPGVEVIGLDLNRPELEQGARVFAGNRDLVFAFGDLFEDLFPRACFDVIVLAGSVQYFEDLQTLVKRLFYYLSEKGELHILDSPFYNEKSRKGARERTRAYFERLGHQEMIPHYHHHCLSALSPFAPRMLSDPEKPIQRLLRRFLFTNRSPFPWILLKPGGRSARSSKPAGGKGMIKSP
ncbi:MAG: class I SAM-dependent methyltransferase [Planctomycetota bacterium]|jgi:ubiquinone/menaquinone biosynthesis C-methylase UbiE